MTEKIFTYGLIIFAVSITMALLKKSANTQVKANKNGMHFLRMAKLYGILGWLFVVLGFVFTALLLIFLYDEKNLVLLLIIELLMTFGLGVPCVLYYQNHWVQFDNNNIKVSNFFNKNQTLNWKDIAVTSFNPLTGYLTFKDLKENTLKIHMHLVGFVSLVKKMEEKTKWSAKDIRIPMS